MIVLSHDCEFNEDKRSHFIVARIDSIDRRISAGDLAELEFGNDVQAAAREGRRIALDGFVLPANDQIMEGRFRVNFTAAASWPMRYADDALKLKRAELDHDARTLLRRKVAYFFGRDADDIPDDQKMTPEDFRASLEASEG